MVKVTSPLGVPLPETGATVAVKVTEAPTFDGLALEARTVVVATWLTVWLTGAAVDALWTVSPL